METPFQLFGRAGEEYVRDWLKKQGYFVIPASLIERGGAPLLEGHIRSHVLPDNQVAKDGLSSWVEVKTKWRMTENAKRKRCETGCELRQFNDYLAVQKATGIKASIAFIHVVPPRLLIGELNNIATDMAKLDGEEFANLRRRDPNHRFKEPMAFFDVDRFDWHYLEEGLLFKKIKQAKIEPENVRPWESKPRQGPRPFLPGW